jgi:hypothetical protein
MATDRELCVYCIQIGIDFLFLIVHILTQMKALCNETLTIYISSFLNIHFSLLSSFMVSIWKMTYFLQMDIG